MTTEPYVHKTRLGALKARLEWSKRGQHLWLVEGYRVELFEQYYVFEHGQDNDIKTAPKFRTLTEAFVYVADKVNTDD